MIHLFQALAEIEKDLMQLGVRWALVGGLAVSVWAEPRTTKDIDLAIAVENDREAERIVADFRARGYRLLHEPFERTDMDRMSIVRMVASLPQGRLVVDFLFASSGTEPEIVDSAVQVEVLPGSVWPVATRGHLLALKILAKRNKDLADIDTLLRVASDQDLREARAALDLIERRISVSGRNLQAELTAQIESFSKSLRDNGEF